MFADGDTVLLSLAATDRNIPAVRPSLLPTVIYSPFAKTIRDDTHVLGCYRR